MRVVEWTLGPTVAVGDRQVPERFQIRQQDGDGPLITVECEVLDGSPQVRAVHLVARRREVQVGDLRGVKVQDWLEEALRSATMATQDQAEQPGRTSGGEHSPERVLQVPLSRKYEHRRLNDDLLRQVAAVYRAAANDRPTLAVQQHFGLGAHRTAGLWVKRARQEGFLGAAQKGKAGEATPPKITPAKIAKPRRRAE